MTMMTTSVGRIPFLPPGKLWRVGVGARPLRTNHVGRCVPSALHPRTSSSSADTPSDDNTCNDALTRPTPSHLAWDRTHLWHPYTSLASASEPAPVLPVESAFGCALHLETGERMLDGMSSWWSAVHGYRNPRLDAAARRQLDKMSHVMFGGLTHRPAVALGELLVSVTPDRLDRVFFADSGSVAVEVALKMALQYQRGRGRPGRTKFIGVRGGYHGDTIGAMSVCDPVMGMHSAFRDNLMQNIFVDRPPCDPKYEVRGVSDGDPVTGGGGCNGCTCRTAGDGDGFDHDAALESACRNLEETLEEHSDSVAALILEPLVQGAGGMRFHSPAYLKRARAACDAHAVLLIADEIATGFGRAGGALFACQEAGVEPDIMTAGKALTGGYMTLGVCLASAEVAEGVSAVPSQSGGAVDGGSGGGVALPLMHGPTFMANPLACAVGLESVSMLVGASAAEGENEPFWKRSTRRLESSLRGLAPAASLRSVANVRVRGGIGVIEMREPIDGAWATVRCRELGVWLRPFGRLLYCMPPYIMEDEDVAKVTDAMVQLAAEAGGR